MHLAKIAANDATAIHLIIKRKKLSLRSSRSSGKWVAFESQPLHQNPTEFDRLHHCLFTHLKQKSTTKITCFPYAHFSRTLVLFSLSSPTLSCSCWIQPVAIPCPQSGTNQFRVHFRPQSRRNSIYKMHMKPHSVTQYAHTRMVADCDDTNGFNAQNGIASFECNHHTVKTENNTKQTN